MLNLTRTQILEDINENRIAGIYLVSIYWLYNGDELKKRHAWFELQSDAQAYAKAQNMYLFSSRIESMIYINEEETYTNCSLF